MTEIEKKLDVIPLSTDGSIVGSVLTDIIKYSDPILNKKKEPTLMLLEAAAFDERYATPANSLTIVGKKHLELLCRTLAKHLDLVVTPNE